MKKALALLLALSAILCFGIFAVSATEESTEPVHTDHCYCVNAAFVPTDHTCEEAVTWEDLSTATIANGGHYYLSKHTAKGLTIIDGMEITLCLNGYNLYAGCPITVNKGGIVNICNCKDSGRIYSTTRSKSAVVLANATESEGYGTVNFYSGTISGAANNGASIRSVELQGGDFNMYGGVIINGKSDGSNSNDTYPNLGGNVLIRNHTARVGTFTMNGGTITSGMAVNQGGNVYVYGGQFTMNGGTVTGGYVTGTPAETDTTLVGYGGNFFVTSTSSSRKGTLTLNGGTVTAGTACYGGNITTDGANKGAVNFTINGATISNGVATVDGGNIYMHKTTNGTVFKFQSGTVSGGQATNNGGNICVKGGYSPTWTGGTITGGTADNGGNIYFDCDTTANNLAGTTISGGTATKNGGNVCVQSSGDITVSTSSISGGSAAYGGNIYTKKTLIVSGGSFSDGTATGSGGNIYCNAKLTISGGTISGGSAGGTGGNIYTLNSSAVSITGGTITGGIATEHGGNMYFTHVEMVETRTVTISGVTISDGQAGEQGGNIFAGKVGQISMTNVTLSGGKAVKNGSNLYMMANGTGEITGCSFILENAEKCSSSGGNVTFSSANCTLTDSTVTGGDAANGGAVAVGQNSAVTFDGCTVETAGGTTGKCFYIYPNATLTLKDTDVKNLSDGGTAIWNKGIVVLEGTVNIPQGNLDMMLDCRDQADAYFDITGLTGQDEDYGIRRWQIDATDDDPGLLAIGATDDTALSFFAWADGYETAYNAEEGKIYMVLMAVHAKNGDGIVRGYSSIDEAMAETQEDLGINWYVINTDLDGQTITKSIILDLNGFDMTNTTVNEGVTVKLMDSANDSYDATACGSLSGTVKGQINSVVHTTKGYGGAIKHYVILKDAEGVYTAHRFIAAITHRSLKPTDAALGFKATFNADEVARAAVVSYGYDMWVDEGTAVSSAKSGTFEVNQKVTLRLKNILSDNDANSKVGASGTIYGNTFIQFTVDADGTQVTAYGQTAPTATTLKSFVEGVDAMIAADPAKLNQTQMTALQNMVNTYSKYMTGWATENIIAWTAPVETPSEEPTV